MSEEYKLYLDQMFRVDVAQALREEGYDVLRATEIQHNRADDQQILARAINENRLLVTLDEHFGDWVVLPLRQHPGVIRIKIHPATSEKVSDLLLSFLRMHTQGQFKDHLVILVRKACKVDSNRITITHVYVSGFRQRGSYSTWSTTPCSTDQDMRERKVTIFINVPAAFSGEGSDVVSNP